MVDQLEDREGQCDRCFLAFTSDCRLMGVSDSIPRRKPGQLDCGYAGLPVGWKAVSSHIPPRPRTVRGSPLYRVKKPMEEQFRDEKPGRDLRVAGVYGLDCLFQPVLCPAG